jgi:hypothetical protein
MMVWFVAMSPVNTWPPNHAQSQTPPNHGASGPETWKTPATSRVKFQVTPTEVATGDVVHLTLQVRGSRTHTVRFQLPPEFANFAVRARNESTHSDDKTATVTHTLRVELLATTPTEGAGAPTTPANHLAPNGVIPPIEVRVRAPDGAEQTLRTEPTRVQVRSVRPSASDTHGPQGQHDAGTPKPPTEPQSLWVWNVRAIAATLGLAGLLLAVWGIRRWVRRRAAHAASRGTKRRVDAPAQSAMSAWQQAMHTIERLHREQLEYLARGQGDAWADALSDCLREYVGAHYGFDGLRCTSDEVLSAMRTRRADPAVFSTAHATLHACDWVKFAKSPLTPSTCDTLIAQAREIVHRMRPAEPTAHTELAPGRTRPILDRSEGIV